MGGPQSRRSRVLAGMSLKDSQIGDALGVTVMAIWRGQHAILVAAADV